MNYAVEKNSNRHKIWPGDFIEASYIIKPQMRKYTFSPTQRIEDNSEEK